VSAESVATTANWLLIAAPAPCMRNATPFLRKTRQLPLDAKGAGGFDPTGPKRGASIELPGAAPLAWRGTSRWRPQSRGWYEIRLNYGN
jgi:hypothetical protein